MTFHGYEVDILSALLGLLLIGTKVSLAYVVPRLKSFIDSKVSATHAQVANSVIDSLAKITESVVQEGNQLWIADAKKNGIFTAEMAQQAKADAIKAVMNHAPELVALGQQVIGDVPAFIGSLVDKFVAQHHISGVKPTVPPATQDKPAAESTDANKSA